MFFLSGGQASKEKDPEADHEPARHLGGRQKTTPGNANIVTIRLMVEEAGEQ